MKTNLLEKIVLLFFMLLYLVLLQSCSTDSEIPIYLDETSSLKDFSIEEAYPNESGDLMSINSGSEYAMTYERINGKNVLEGDIILSDLQVKQLSKLNSNQKGTGLASVSTRWPNCTIFYKINSNLQNRSRVTNAIAHWKTSHPHLNFVTRTNQTNYVEFISAPLQGCSSELGMVGGRQYINLDFGCTTGNTIHEIGHALGIMHEQSRADRDNSIIINWNNIRPGREHNFQSYSQQGINGFEMGNFDFGSIMMYSSDAFSRNGLPTITKLDGSTFGAQRTALSNGDIAIAEEMYDCPPPFRVKINGPPVVNYIGFKYYTWYVSILNQGAAPYSYQWFVSSNQGQTYTIPVGSNSSSFTTSVVSYYADDIYMKVIVTDSDGDQAFSTFIFRNYSRAF